MSNPTAAADLGRFSLCEDLGGPAPIDPTAVLDVLLPQLRAGLARADRETLTTRLWQAEVWRDLWAEHLRHAPGVLDLADDLADDLPHLADDRREYAERARRIAAALRVVSPLLALLRRLLTARCGGDPRAATLVIAAGRALSAEDRAALLALAWAAEDSAAARRIAERVRRACADLDAPAAAPGFSLGDALIETLRSRVLPTRAPPRGRAVTAAA